MTNNTIEIKNVRGRLNKDGIAELNIEDVARGLGFVEIKNGIEYVRWRTINSYLKEFIFSQQVAKNKFSTCGESFQQVGKDDFIPENIFYKLCFKANNEIARKFQDLVTDEILPSIRKHGVYATKDLLNNPDFLIEVLQELKNERKEREQLKVDNKVKDQVIAELKPKADYTDRILQSKGLTPVSIIAKDYGMTANKFNALLNELRIQYKQGETWLLYAKYQDKGYTHSKTFDYEDSKGLMQTRLNTQWTQKGRLFLYNILKENGIAPMIERW